LIEGGAVRIIGENNRGGLAAGEVNHVGHRLGFKAVARDGAEEVATICPVGKSVSGRQRGACRHFIFCDSVSQTQRDARRSRSDNGVNPTFHKKFFERGRGGGNVGTLIKWDDLDGFVEYAACCVYVVLRDVNRF
jgi:hypothetical protein